MEPGRRALRRLAAAAQSWSSPVSVVLPPPPAPGEQAAIRATLLSLRNQPYQWWRAVACADPAQSGETPGTRGSADVTPARRPLGDPPPGGGSARPGEFVAAIAPRAPGDPPWAAGGRRALRARLTATSRTPTGTTSTAGAGATSAPGLRLVTGAAHGLRPRRGAWCSSAPTCWWPPGGGGAMTPPRRSMPSSCAHRATHGPRSTSPWWPSPDPWAPPTRRRLPAPTALEAWLRARDPGARVEAGRAPGITDVRFEPEEPADVDIVIPTRDRVELLRRCLRAWMSAPTAAGWSSSTTAAPSRRH